MKYKNDILSYKNLACANEDITLSSSFFDTLENLYQKDKNEVPANEGDLPFSGGWFVYLAYEMAEQIEPCLSMPSLPDEQPLAIAARCPAGVIYDKKNNQLFAVAEENYHYLLDELEQDYLNIFSQGAEKSIQSGNETVTAENKIELESLVEADSKSYLNQVDKIKQYIVEGDIFQANLSRLWQAKLKYEVDDTILFKELSKQNPSSFAAMACLENITIISSSPERLVSL